MGILWFLDFFILLIILAVVAGYGLCVVAKKVYKIIIKMLRSMNDG